MLDRLELREVVELELEGVAPYDFELTIHKPAGWDWLTPFEAYSEGTVWTGMRVADRPVGLRVTSVGAVERPKVKVTVYSDDELSEREEKMVSDRVSFCLKIGEDIADFYVLAESHPVLGPIKDDLYGMRDTPRPDVFCGSILAVTLQMAPIKRSSQMRRDLYQAYGDRLSFDGRTIVIAPPPGRIAATKKGELGIKCKLGYRASFLQSIARAIELGDVPPMDELVRMSPDDARRELMRLKGIGDYSADIISPHGGFPVDVWSAGIFAKLFGIEVKGEVRELIPNIKERAEELFGRWKGYVFVYVLNDLRRLANVLSRR